MDREAGQEAIMMGQRGQEHLDCSGEGGNPGRKQIHKEVALWGWGRLSLLVEHPTEPGETQQGQEREKMVSGSGAHAIQARQVPGQLLVTVALLANR